MREELIEDPSRVATSFTYIFQDEAVLSRNALAFRDLWNCPREFRDFVELPRERLHSEKGHQFVAQVFGI